VGDINEKMEIIAVFNKFKDISEAVLIWEPKHQFLSSKLAKMS
jgi:hypothetical protein